MKFTLAFIVLVLDMVISTTFADLTNSERDKQGHHDENGLVEVLNRMNQIVNLQQLPVSDSKYAKVQSLGDKEPKTGGDKSRNFAYKPLADVVQREGDRVDILSICAHKCHESYGKSESDVTGGDASQPMNRISSENLDHTVNQQGLFGDSKHAAKQKRPGKLLRYGSKIGDFVKNSNGGHKLKQGMTYVSKGVADYARRVGKYGSHVWDCYLRCYLEQEIENLRRKSQNEKFEPNLRQQLNELIDEIEKRLRQLVTEENKVPFKKFANLKSELAGIKKFMEKHQGEKQSDMAGGNHLPQLPEHHVKRYRHEKSHLTGGSNLQLRAENTKQKQRQESVGTGGDSRQQMEGIRGDYLDNQEAKELVTY